MDDAFAGLSVEHRAVLVLHYYVGMSIAEIATTLGIPYGTVGSRLHYGLRSLRAAFGVGGESRSVDEDRVEDHPLFTREGSR